jgi:hypothetical protein
MPQDLSSIRDLALADEKIATLLAHVAVLEGETSHWHVTPEGHVAVTVKTHRHGVPVTAIMPTSYGSARGVWGIPDVGTEVAIGFNGGDFEDDAYVLAIYGHASPSLLESSRLVIVGDEVHVYDGSGATRPLAFRDEVVSVDSKYATHVHQIDTPLGMSAPPVSTALPNPGPPPPTFIPGPPLPTLSLPGTQVLKAK